MNVLCGYGEKPSRIILSSSAVVLFYATAYSFLNAVELAESGSYRLTLGDYIYYSIVTFATVGYGDFVPKSAPLYRLIAASEAFIGAFIIGLFIFTLARRYSAR